MNKTARLSYLEMFGQVHCPGIYGYAWSLVYPLSAEPTLCIMRTGW